MLAHLPAQRANLRVEPRASRLIRLLGLLMARSLGSPSCSIHFVALRHGIVHLYVTKFDIYNFKIIHWTHNSLCQKSFWNTSIVAEGPSCLAKFRREPTLSLARLVGLKSLARLVANPVADVSPAGRHATKGWTLAPPTCGH